MSRHFQIEIEKLKKMILHLSANVEVSVRKAVTALHERNIELANQVIANGETVDKLEINVEEECLKILALHQPVAIDLRFIISILKIDNDLERIDDLAINIAERAIAIAQENVKDLPFDFHKMSERVMEMLKLSLDALVKIDTTAAREVCRIEDEIDEMHRLMYDKIKTQIKQNPQNVDLYFHYGSISRYLERIADHAKKIAEDVIYMVDAEIVRHRNNW